MEKELIVVKVIYRDNSERICTLDKNAHIREDGKLYDYYLNRLLPTENIVNMEIIETKEELQKINPITKVIWNLV